MSPQFDANRMVIGNIAWRVTLLNEGFEYKGGPIASGHDPIFVNRLELISSVRAEVIQMFEEASSNKYNSREVRNYG